MDVTINGKAHPIRFSLNVSRLFCREKGIELYEMGERFSKVGENMTLEELEDLALFILIALREGARKQGKECTLIIEDVIDQMEDESFLPKVFAIQAMGSIPEGESTEKKT